MHRLIGNDTGLTCFSCGQDFYCSTCADLTDRKVWEDHDDTCEAVRLKDMVPCDSDRKCATDENPDGVHSWYLSFPMAARTPLTDDQLVPTCHFCLTEVHPPEPEIWFVQDVATGTTERVEGLTGPWIHGDDPDHVYRREGDDGPIITRALRRCTDSHDSFGHHLPGVPDADGFIDNSFCEAHSFEAAAQKPGEIL